MVAVLAWSTPAHASRLGIGELDGGGVIWDGSQDVRTMNVNGAGTEVLGDSFVVTMTLNRDFDGQVSFSVVRLVLSVNAQDVDQFLPGELKTPNEVRVKPFDSQSPTLDEPIVALSTNLVRQGSTWVLSAQGIQDRNNLFAAHPGLTYRVGLLVGSDGNTLDNCDTGFDPVCIDEDVFRGAVANFTIPTVPEPLTFCLMGAGLAASTLRRRRR